MVHELGTFAILVGLELVLGIDNVLIISILTGRLPLEHQKRARLIGLGGALFARVLFLFGAAYISQLTTNALGNFSWRDLVLLAGGAFLLFKATREIHHVVEGKHASLSKSSASVSFGKTIAQIILLDAVFSVDSVITAVGLSNSLWIIIASVLVSFIVVLLAAARISSFVETHPAMKILALSFLMCIGVTLGIEGMGYHVPKAFIYLPMGFSLMVELLQMRFSANQKRTS